MTYVKETISTQTASSQIILEKKIRYLIHARKHAQVNNYPMQSILKEKKKKNS